MSGHTDEQEHISTGVSMLGILHEAIGSFPGHIMEREMTGGDLDVGLYPFWESRYVERLS
jgi:hypothetical protein